MAELTDQDPDTVADLIIAAADPFETISKVARETGLSNELANALVKKLREEHGDLVDKLQESRTRDLADILEEKAYIAANLLTPDKMRGSSARDISIVMGVLLDKAQLLRGRPTQIVSHEERMNLQELMAAMTKEADRRGMIIDLHAEDVQILDEPVERKVRPHVGQRSIHELNHLKQIEKMEESGEPT